VNGDWNHHFPPSYRRSGLAPQPDGNSRNAWLSWEEDFELEEVVRTDTEAFMREIEADIKRSGGYPAWRYRVEPVRQAEWRAAASLGTRLRRAVQGD
jgi:hypothetical protein